MTRESLYVGELLPLVQTRTEAPAETLTDFIRKEYTGTESIEQRLMPLVDEISRRFKHRQRKPDITGKPVLICGFRRFSDWAKSVTPKSVRTVQRQLKAYRVSQGLVEKKTKNDDLSLLEKQSQLVEEYLRQKLAMFKGKERQQLCDTIRAAISS